MTDLFGPTCPCCGQPMPEQIEARPFEAFWRHWPDKRGKATAEAAWRKLTPAERQIACQRVEAWCKEWRKRNPQASHIMAATFLNQRRFLDDMPQPAPAKQRPRLEVWAERIKKGIPALCRDIPPSAVDEMMERGMVTRDECRRVSL